jgi:putative transposase
VEQNPVKAYIVKYPWEYKYSSVRYRLNIQEDKLLSNYKVIDSIEDYKSFLLNEVDSKKIKEKTQTGKPCGNDEFYEKIKELTGNDYSRKKPGPKVDIDN